MSPERRLRTTIPHRQGCHTSGRRRRVEVRVPTPPPATTAEFLTLVRRTGLLADVPADLPDPPDKAAGELVRRKLLTPFQARMILSGRTRGFTLGDYVIRDQIGQGGMGFVYLAVHRTLGRKAAVKVLPPSIAADQLARAVPPRGPHRRGPRPPERGQAVRRRPRRRGVVPGDGVRGGEDARPTGEGRRAAGVHAGRPVHRPGGRRPPARRTRRGSSTATSSRAT